MYIKSRDIFLTFICFIMFFNYIFFYERITVFHFKNPNNYII